MIMSTSKGQGTHNSISTHLGRRPAMADEPVLMGLAELPDVAVFVVGIRVGQGYTAMSVFTLKWPGDPRRTLDSLLREGLVFRRMRILLGLVPCLVCLVRRVYRRCRLPVRL